MRRVLLGVVLVGCGDNLQPIAETNLVQVTNVSPFGDCSIGIPGGAAPSDEVEPMISIDPTNPMHLIGAWQQDRSLQGGAGGVGSAVTFDGGATWSTAFPRASRCTLGDSLNGGDYSKTTDPWVTFGADGTPYFVALSFEGAKNSILAFTSVDGGVTWGDAVTLITDEDPDVFNDKESVTGDPDEPDQVYAVWDRLTGLQMPTMPIGTGPTQMARMSSRVWEPATPILDPGIDAQTIGNIVVVLPDGALVDIAMVLTMASSKTPQATQQVVRSVDKGMTWSEPVVIDRVFNVGVSDPTRPEMFVRSGAGLPSVAVDRMTGQIYAVWEDSRFSPTGDEHDNIAIVTSVDGGETWSRPVRVDQSDAPAFEPQVAVADDGTVGVLYYDTRDNRAGDANKFIVTAWLATSADHGATWSDESLTEPFDLRTANIGGTYFLGDYQGLVTSGNTFVPFFAAATAHGTNIYVRPVPR